MIKTSFEIRMGGVAFGHADTLEKAKEIKAKMEEIMIGTAVIVEMHKGREVLTVEDVSVWAGKIDD
jgi:hypothetical protein